MVMRKDSSDDSYSSESLLFLLRGLEDARVFYLGSVLHLSGTCYTVKNCEYYKMKGGGQVMLPLSLGYDKK